MNLSGRKCATKYCRNEAAKHRTVCHKCHSRRFKEMHPIAYHFNALRNNARRRGKQFRLTLAEFEAFCRETGYMDGKGKSANSLSIDRVNQHEGYSQDNIRILTLAENSSRGIKDETECPF